MISPANLFIIASCFAMTHGLTTCKWPNSNGGIASDLIQTCYDSDKQYCCINTNGDLNCCTFMEFSLTYIIIAVVCVAIISILCCVISCCCCPCCMCYKRRHGAPV